MELTGKLVAVMPLQTGISITGNVWEKQDFIIETSGQFPKKIYLVSFGKKNVSIESVTIGTELTVSIEVESKEYNGKWFTTCKCLNFTFNTESILAADAETPIEQPEQEETFYKAPLPF